MPAVLLGVCYWVLFGQPGVGQGCWLERHVLIQGQLLSGMHGLGLWAAEPGTRQYGDGAVCATREMSVVIAAIGAMFVVC